MFTGEKNHNYAHLFVAYRQIFFTIEIITPIEDGPLTVEDLLTVRLDHCLNDFAES